MIAFAVGDAGASQDLGEWHIVNQRLNVFIGTDQPGACRLAEHEEFPTTMGDDNRLVVGVVVTEEISAESSSGISKGQAKAVILRSSFTAWFYVLGDAGVVLGQREEFCHR